MKFLQILTRFAVFLWYDVMDDKNLKIEWKTKDAKQNGEEPIES